MHKKLSFIALLALFSLNPITSPLLAAGTDNGQQEEVPHELQSNQEQRDASSVDLIKDEKHFDLAEENQEDLTPYITFSNETEQSTTILKALLKGRVINDALGYIYHIEARNSCKSTIDALYDLLKSDIKLQFTGMKKNNDPKDHQGNASVSAEY